MSSIAGSRALMLCAIAMPILVAVGVRFFGAGASDAIASQPIPVHEPFTFPALWDSQVPSSPVQYTQVKSPLYYDQTYLDTQPKLKPDRIESAPSPPRPMSMPDFSVTSILPSAKNSLAVIDGKPRRIGDTLADGWVVEGISGKDFTVTLVHSSGRKISVKLSQKP